jgi:hypothetical protein
MIITAQDDLIDSIMLDFKSLCSTSNVYRHSEGKFGGGVEATEQLFNTLT